MSMIFHWLKPNKVGTALFAIMFPLIWFIFMVIIFMFMIIIPNPWVWLFGWGILLTAPYLLAMLSDRIMENKRENMKRRKILLGVAIGATLCFFILSALLIASHIGPNRGLPFGYYGEFNRVEHRLQQISAVTILDYSQHHDLRLEDFGFTLQTNEGLKFHLAFYDHNKTYQLFGRADGLAIRMPSSQSWALYPFRHGEHLESATGKEIRNAVDVLKEFDKIAEVIESDYRKGMPEVGWEGVPKGYLWITLPSFSLQPVE